MARQARVKDEFGTYLISQNGGTKHPLFQTDADRIKFLEILKKAEKKFNFILYAYCVSSDNHYDLVIDVDGSDLSNVMKSINISYAMYVKSETKLFRDRYKSQVLETDHEKEKVLQEIQNRKPERELWRMCFENKELELADIDLTKEVKRESLDVYFTGCDQCIKSIEAAREKLHKLAVLENMHIEKYIKDREKRNELIRTFRKYSTLSLKEIGELFGGLSESSICKILNDC